jgi:hypothetical protein
MNLAELTRILVYGAVINYTILIVWFLAFVMAHKWLYQMHVKWFRLSPATFDAMHYGGMAVYKLGIVLFTVVPAVALYLTRM